MKSIYHGLGKGRRRNQARQEKKKYPGKNSRIQSGSEVGTFWFLVRHSYHWATGSRWQWSVGRWYFHRTSFKFWLHHASSSPFKGWLDWAEFAAEQWGAQPWPKPSKQSLSVMTWLVALVINEKLITNGFGKGGCRKQAREERNILEKIPESSWNLNSGPPLSPSLTFEVYWSWSSESWNGYRKLKWEIQTRNDSTETYSVS